MQPPNQQQQNSPPNGNPGLLEHLQPERANTPPPTPNSGGMNIGDKTHRRLIAEMNQERDKLRSGEGNNTVRSKRSRLITAITRPILALLPLALIVGVFLPIAQSKEDGSTLADLREAKSRVVPFEAPANIKNLPDEEQAALSVIELARQNRPKQIVSGWADQTNQGWRDSAADFVEMIKTYSEHGNGAQYELVEKKLDKKIFSDPTGERTVTSMVYKGGYLGYKNGLYVKLNFYKNEKLARGSGDSGWRLYQFEYSSPKDGSVPLKADFN